MKMNRRGILGAAIATLPMTVANAATTNSRLEDLKEKIAAAAIFYEDNISYDSYTVYFNGVLAAQGLNDWIVTTDKTGKEAGFIVDISVQFDKGSEFFFIPVRFSSDYWSRKNRLEELTCQLQRSSKQ